MKYMFQYRYPEIAGRNGVEGRVILEFVVEKDGKVGRIKILRDWINMWIRHVLMLLKTFQFFLR